MVFCSGYLPLFIGVVPFDFPVIKEAENFINYCLQVGG